MSIEKCKDFIKDGFGTWDDSPKPTTLANLHDFMKNQNNLVLNLSTMLWQPETAYELGAIVQSPSMPYGYIAKVVVAGLSGEAEPEWAEGNITDGNVTWIVYNPESSVKSLIESSIKSALAKAMYDTVYKQAKLDAHPIGSIYESTDSTSPAELFGGTWEAMDAGRVLVAQGTASTGTVFTAGATGGEEKHKLTTSELPSHTHGMSTEGNHSHLVSRNRDINDVGANGAVGYDTIGPYDGTKTYSTSSAGAHSHTIYSTGGSQPFNIMQPYEVVYRWRRIA